MIDDYINDRMIKTVKRIVLEDPDVVFCGSLGLVLNGRLQRDVKDIDILTPTNYYNGTIQNKALFWEERMRKPSDSHKFMVGKDEVLCFKIEVYGIDIDVLYNQYTQPEYSEHEFDGVWFKVEDPESAIRAKKLYVVNDKSQYSVIKHLKDLIFMGIDKMELIELINASILVEDKDRRIILPKEEEIVDDLPF